MKETLRRTALDLGFDLCRFTTAAPPATGAQFTSWLDQGLHGGLDYLRRSAAKRADPRLVLPGARSIILLAINYGAPHVGAPSGRASQEPCPLTMNHPLSRPEATLSPTRSGGEGAPACAKRSAAGRRRAGEGNSHRSVVPRCTKSPGEEPSQEGRFESSTVSPGFKASHATASIARYARFTDYHQLLLEPLGQLARQLQALGGPEVRSLWYTDTGPLLERDLAQRAGVGFVGKHTHLVSRQFGNWLLLAEVLTTLELEPDPPEINRCGTCERCLQRCPTQAFPAPFVLDARRCLSYWTIEARGPIPLEFRPRLGGRVFGCDDCLEACPWNRFASRSRRLLGAVRPSLEEPDLLALASLDAEEFNRSFQDTPLARVQRRGLVRNACVALGNVGTPEALPVLERLADDVDPLIAEHAAWAKQRLERPAR